MPGSNEVIITSSLAKELKHQLRYVEFQTDQAILSLILNKKYRISGICEGNDPLIYFTRLDYVNFLDIYSEIKFQDSTFKFFEKDFLNLETFETLNSYTAEIAIYEGETIYLKNDQAVIELNRSSTYKMMSDSKDADYKIDKANRILLKNPEFINIYNSYPMFIREFKLNCQIFCDDLSGSYKKADFSCKFYVCQEISFFLFFLLIKFENINNLSILIVGK